MGTPSPPRPTPAFTTGPRHYLRLLRVLLRTSIQDDAAYRGEFLAQLGNALYGVATAAISLWIFFSQTKTLGGWSLDQIIVLIGVFHILSGVVRAVFAPNLNQVSEDVRTGALDFTLTKPGASQFLVSFRRIVISALADSLLGLLLITFGIIRLGGADLAAVLLFAAALMCACAILYAFWLFIITFVFWFVRVDNVTQLFWSLFEAGKYPVTIYPGWLRFVVTFLIPTAIVTTVPTQGLGGHLTPAGLLVFAAAAALALWLSSRFWRFGVRHYTSASS
ncbi:MAG TPA: ABC-2 family transporter protein [Limnochordia bacterium]|nr:ABC-2 family transporter protein [Limnochordia bacterium]